MLSIDVRDARFDSLLNNRQKKHEEGKNKKQKKNFFFLLFSVCEVYSTLSLSLSVEKRRNKSAAREIQFIRTRSNIMNKVIECVPNFSEGQRKEVFFPNKKIDGIFSLRLSIPLHMLSLELTA